MRFNLLLNSFCHAVDKKYTYFYSLTFWSAFSFSSRLWVAWSRFVWVWVSSCSNCCIFFSNASTSSFAFYTHFLLSKCPVWTILLNKLHTTEYPVFVGVDLWFNIKIEDKKFWLVIDLLRWLTFWRAFSFSSSLWFAFINFSWVWSRSFSSCCIFFWSSRTSSSAYCMFSSTCHYFISILMTFYSQKIVKLRCV